jgi:hypothetical protein
MNPELQQRIQNLMGDQPLPAKFGYDRNAL